jgi:ABC-type branched-subunit amino acid transport system substrate-binding protein
VDALAAFQSKRFSDAESQLKSLILSGSPDDKEAAAYLMIRVQLARREGKEALCSADQFCTKYPASAYTEYARYARAEAFFLNHDLLPCADELHWISNNASDERLKRRANQALPVLAESAGTPEEKSELDQRVKSFSETVQLTEGNVAFIIAFPGAEGDPTARQMLRSFRYVADYGDHPFPVTIIVVSSAYEAAIAAKSLMQDDSLLLLVFAGDESAALGVTFLSNVSKVPVLKLTSDTRTLTTFGSELFEFLPSSATQAAQLGKFAARDLHNQSGMILSSADEKGRALALGFKSGMIAEHGRLESEEYYSPETESVRPDLERVFANKTRISSGKSPLRGALTPEERAELFGNARGGEVLMGDHDSDIGADSSRGKEALFFGIISEKIDAFSSQLRTLPRDVTFFGNSSWIDNDALSRQSKITDGMFISAPLLPEPLETDDLLRRFETAIGGKATAWELLGLDAAQFVSQVMTKKPQRRSEIRSTILNITPFFGRVVTVKFEGKHENQTARILKYEDGELKVVQ